MLSNDTINRFMNEGSTTLVATEVSGSFGGISKAQRRCSDLKKYAQSAQKLYNICHNIVRLHQSR